MDREPPRAKAGHLQVLIHHVLYGLLADPAVPVAEEQRLVVDLPVCLPQANGQVPLQGVLAGGIEVDQPLLIALPYHPHRAQFRVNVVQADARQLPHPQSAVEKQGDDGIVPLPVPPFRVSGHGIQQLQGFLHGQILGQGLFLFRCVNVGRRVVLEKSPLVDEEFIQCLDGGQLPGLGGRPVGTNGIRIQQEGIDLLGGDSPNKFQISLLDRYLGESLRVMENVLPVPADQVAEKGAQIQQVLVHRPLGTALYHQLVGSKLLHDG